MNLEQIEGQLSESNERFVSVVVPIRGTVVQAFFGILDINPDWANNVIIYSLRFYPDQEISFQAADVEKIIKHPTELLQAAIILKSDSRMEQFKFENA